MADMLARTIMHQCIRCKVRHLQLMPAWQRVARDDVTSSLLTVDSLCT